MILGLILLLVSKSSAYFTCDEVKRSYQDNDCCDTSGTNVARFDVKSYGRGQLKEFRSMTSAGTPYFALLHTDNTRRRTIIDFAGVGVELGQQAAMYQVNNPVLNPSYNYVQLDGDVTVRELHEILGLPELYCDNIPATPEGDYRCTQRRALSGNVTRLNTDVLEIMDKLVADGSAIEDAFVISGVSLGTITGLASTLQSDEIMKRVRTIGMISGLWGIVSLGDISAVNRLRGKNIYLSLNVNDPVLYALVGAGRVYDFPLSVGMITSALGCNATPASSPVIQESELYKLTEHKYECSDGVFERLEYEIDESYPGIPLGYVSSYTVPITHFFTIPMSSETIPVDYWDGSQTIYSSVPIWNFLNRVN